MNNGVKWVWLDLDDTLVDFSANSLSAIKQVYTKYNLGDKFPDVETWIDAYHYHNGELWKQYNVGKISQTFLRMERFRLPLTQYGYSDEDACRLSAEMDPVYLDFLAEGKATVAGAHDLLHFLKDNGYKVGVLSNGFNGVQQKKLRSAGMADLIDLIVLSDEIGINKPDVKIYRYAQERSGESNVNAHMMIGDNPDTDIAGAISAGWHAIFFNRGGRTSANLPMSCPVVDNLADIPLILASSVN